MKKYEEMTFAEQEEVVEQFANWLSQYTHEVIIKVMKQREEIIANEFAMNLLRELKARDEEEKDDFTHSIGHMLGDFETFGKHNPHNHPITHAGSYRDILYDMYIR